MFGKLKLKNPSHRTYSHKKYDTVKITGLDKDEEIVFECCDIDKFEFLGTENEGKVVFVNCRLSTVIMHGNPSLHLKNCSSLYICSRIDLAVADGYFSNNNEVWLENCDNVRMFFRSSLNKFTANRTRFSAYFEYFENRGAKINDFVCNECNIFDLTEPENAQIMEMHFNRCTFDSWPSFAYLAPRPTTYVQCKFVLNGPSLSTEESSPWLEVPAPFVAECCNCGNTLPDFDYMYGYFSPEDSEYKSIIAEFEQYRASGTSVYVRNGTDCGEISKVPTQNEAVFGRSTIKIMSIRHVFDDHYELYLSRDYLVKPIADSVGVDIDKTARTIGMYIKTETSLKHLRLSMCPSKSLYVDTQS